MRMFRTPPIRHFRVLCLMTAVSLAAVGCNDPLNPTITHQDSFWPKTTGTISGTLMLVDPAPANGFSFPAIAEAANIQIILYKDLVFTTAVDGAGNPVRVPSLIARRPLSGLDNETLDLGVPETLDFTITDMDGLSVGDYGATVILDLDGNGNYDPQNDCIQFLPAGTAPVEGQALPVAASVVNYSDVSLNTGPGDLVFLPGSLMCGPGEAPSTASISGNITNSISMTIEAPTLATAPVFYLSLYYEPADFSDPSDGGTLPPDYLQPYPVPAFAGTYSTPYTLAIPYLLDADTVNMPGTLPPGNYGIQAYLSQTGAFPTGAPVTGDCVGAANDGDYSITLDDVTDSVVSIYIGFCFGP